MSLSPGIGPSQLFALPVIVFGDEDFFDLPQMERVRVPVMRKIVDALVRQGVAQREVPVQTEAQSP